MQRSDVQLVSQGLSPAEILDLEEDILRQREVDPSLPQLRRQVVVAIEVELEPERCPRRNP
jgi:hypothetical protein